jgi:hypothetical protein
MGSHPATTAPTTSGATTTTAGTTDTAAGPRPQQAVSSGPSWRGTAVALVAIALLAAGAVARFRRSGR